MILAEKNNNLFSYFLLSMTIITRFANAVRDMARDAADTNCREEGCHSENSLTSDYCEMHSSKENVWR